MGNLECISTHTFSNVAACGYLTHLLIIIVHKLCNSYYNNKILGLLFDGKVLDFTRANKIVVRNIIMAQITSNIYLLTVKNNYGQFFVFNFLSATTSKAKR